MKVHIRFDKQNEKHSHLTLFINGQNNGQLCMSPAEADWFYFILQKGVESMDLGDGKLTFVGSGSNAEDGAPIRPLP